MKKKNRFSFIVLAAFMLCGSSCHKENSAGPATIILNGSTKFYSQQPASNFPTGYIAADGRETEEQGFHAYDNQGNDITGMVTISYSTPESYTPPNWPIYIQEYCYQWHITPQSQQDMLARTPQIGWSAVVTYKLIYKGQTIIATRQIYGLN